MIRQAISCDICATEKKQNNNWFVASEQGGELRVSGWSSRNRLRPGTKHLCGQTCLHKLVDEFMVRTIAVRMQQGIQEESVHGLLAAPTGAGLSAVAAYEHPGIVREHPVFAEGESSARLLAPPTPPGPILPKRPVPRSVPELVPMPGRHVVEQPVVLDDTSRFASRNWRAEAWDRERERESRSVEHGSEINPRRRAGS